jgi:hypothetical protein
MILTGWGDIGKTCPAKPLKSMALAAEHQLILPCQRTLLISHANWLPIGYARGLLRMPLILTLFMIAYVNQKLTHAP